MQSCFLCICHFDPLAFRTSFIVHIGLRSLSLSYFIEMDEWFSLEEQKRRFALEMEDDQG